MSPRYFICLNTTWNYIILRIFCLLLKFCLLKSRYCIILHIFLLILLIIHLCIDPPCIYFPFFFKLFICIINSFILFIYFYLQIS